MKKNNENYIQFFDDSFNAQEQFPRQFTLSFTEIENTDDKKNEVRVILDNKKQLGDIINDNSYTNDFYRYHDIFHYTFATLLGWSPCARAMMRKKRKSNDLYDRIEDGAKAIITEEAISMIIFNEAKRKNYFSGTAKVSRTTLRIIKEMTENFEVKIRTSKDWEYAIQKSYEIFRLLIKNKGGNVKFDALSRNITYISVN
ncbi:nucleotide pyrophosphohydrolase [Chryseobacterium nepalense]|uniref:Nucleotide pyrophosphohydrolase n=1 Tax=Chryseobacterium nepalense TaxID=1854498 RepID=A0ABY4K685_9FLAO|nr:nucleotide pyrophosphohydrolase [Chryseobacterium nepalense]UPQ75263.1 nucleotide pyrophosphohydrolase [Chryseobacterium nepalense]